MTSVRRSISLSLSISRDCKWVTGVVRAKKHFRKARVLRTSVDRVGQNVRMTRRGRVIVKSHMRSIANCMDHLGVLRHLHAVSPGHNTAHHGAVELLAQHRACSWYPSRGCHHHGHPQASVRPHPHRGDPPPRRCCACSKRARSISSNVRCGRFQHVNPPCMVRECMCVCVNPFSRTGRARYSIASQAPDHHNWPATPTQCPPLLE